MIITEDINEALLQYVDKHCAHCYASLRPDGRLQLDGLFKAQDLAAILAIANITLPMKIGDQWIQVNATSEAPFTVVIN